LVNTGYVSILALAMLCFVGMCTAQMMRTEVATNDGLTLGFGARGAIVSCCIDGHELLAPGAPGGIFVADVEDIPAQDIPLGENMGFEQIEADRPTGWQVGPDWQLDRQVAHCGAASMRVSLPGSTPSRSGSLAIDVAVKPNTPYRASMWLRTQGCHPSFYIEQYDAQGKMHRDYPQIVISHDRTNEDWFQIGRSFTTAFFCRRVRLRCDIWDQCGTAWLDDVSLVCLEDDYESPQRLAEGEVNLTSDGAEQVCELADLSLRLRTLYRGGPDVLTVNGEVEDTSGEDRAVTVSFRLPINASGWKWYNDIQNEQVIEDGGRYGAVRLLDGEDPTQRRTIALYPFSAMGKGDIALALAVPMDQPRVFRLCYDLRFGYLVNYEFGLTRAAKKFPGKAAFQFFVYRVDSPWGLRSAAQRYYEFFPLFFVKRTEREGGLGGMIDFESTEPSGVVAPVFATFDYRQSIAGNRRELAQLLRYTEFTGWWGWALGITPEEAERRPTADAAWSHVEDLADRDPPDDVAVSILNCALHDRAGDRRLHWEYVSQWGGYNYLCNPDPEITGRGGAVSRFSLTYEREVSEVDLFKLDGMRYDNPIVFATDNFRREHFQWADHPLAFDHRSKRPVIPLDFSSFECGKAIADDMHSRGKLVASNYTPAGYPSDIFHIHYLDVVSNEMLWTWPTNAHFALQRALAGQKVVCMSGQEVKADWSLERIEFEMKQAMFYGTFYHLSTASDLYQRWVPLTTRIARAGWEPVTLARCAALGPMVERFGRVADQNLHFTLRNETDEAVRAEVMIDANALELQGSSPPGLWQRRDAHTYEALPVDRQGPRWLVTVAVPARDTAVLRIATPSDMALDHLFPVTDSLRRAANYRDALLDANVALVCPDYETLMRSVQALQRMLTAAKVPSSGVPSQLRSIEAALTVPEVRPPTAETAWWSTRMTECTAAARQGISEARAVFGNEP